MKHTLYKLFAYFALVTISLSAMGCSAADTAARFKEEQSDEEICIRNYGGTWACKNDADYRKLFSGVMKNGGCITSVPDVGQMVRDWNYCKNTTETIDIMYFPTGETKIFNKNEYSALGKPPMTDAEYAQELEEYKKGEI